MTTELNKEALEAAKVAALKVFEGDISPFHSWEDHLSAINTAAITAYLAAPPSPDTGEVGELIERLESHMGKQDVSILLEDCRAAAKELRALTDKLEEAKQIFKRDGELISAADARAEKAEARFAQAVEALDEITRRYSNGANADTLRWIAQKALNTIKEHGNAE